jgi:hypothetical protein
VQYDITLRTRLDRDALEAEVQGLVASGPFVVTGPEPRGTGIWLFRVAPRNAEISVSFTKFAELQLLLARNGEVISLVRTDLGLAVAS